MPRKRKNKDEFRQCRDCKRKPTRSPQHYECGCCYSKKWRTKNPLRRVWHDLKKSARHRNIGFEITFAEFEKFISGTQYMEKRGRLWDNFTIDRIREGEPYHKDNIQILKKGENSAKYWKSWREEKEMRKALDRALAEDLHETPEPIEQEKDLPF